MDPNSFSRILFWKFPLTKSKLQFCLKTIDFHWHLKSYSKQKCKTAVKFHKFISQLIELCTKNQYLNHFFDYCPFFVFLEIIISKLSKIIIVSGSFIEIRFDCVFYRQKNGQRFKSYFIFRLYPFCSHKNPLYYYFFLFMFLSLFHTLSLLKKRHWWLKS